MLTADLVRVRRKGQTLQVRPLDARQRARALTIAEGLCSVLEAGVGGSREDLEDAFSAIEVGAADRRVADGLRKLLLDRCTFEMREGVDPPTARAAVFAAAAAARRALGPDDTFEREAVLAAVAPTLDLTPEALDDALYADLKSAHRLVEVKPISPERLVDAYDRAQAQAVLLRAVQVTIEADFADAGAARTFFQKLKFLRLLFRIEATEGGTYRIELDGPFSLFQASTKYGLQLALMLPALEGAARFALRAEVRWGKDRTPLIFEHAGGGDAAEALESAPLADDVAQLVDRFKALDTPWRVRRSTRVLTLPGVGVCVPDLVFSHTEREERAYLEVMGFWSRDAVWRRVELVEAGLSERIIFAVSSRLRVSEAVLDDDLPGELYVYKGVMNARAIAERLGP
jgi:predicted nuclease of restriction endonuclease-like RecB superfamily